MSYLTTAKVELLERIKHSNIVPSFYVRNDFNDSTYIYAEEGLDCTLENELMRREAANKKRLAQVARRKKAAGGEGASISVSPNENLPSILSRSFHAIPKYTVAFAEFQYHMTKLARALQIMHDEHITHGGIAASAVSVGESLRIISYNSLRYHRAQHQEKYEECVAKDIADYNALYWRYFISLLDQNTKTTLEYCLRTYEQDGFVHGWRLHLLYHSKGDSFLHDLLGLLFTTSTPTF
jgi:hypothetical protein